jgi:hypothetical protein
MLFLLLACADDPNGHPSGPDDSSPPVETGDDTGDSEAPPPPVYTVGVDGPAVIDPKLAPAPLSFVLTHSVTNGGEQGFAHVDVLDDESGTVVRTLADGSAWLDTVEWDGTDAKGAPVASGRYEIHLEELVGGEPVAEASLPVDAVRVGVLAGTLGGKDRIPLTWHYAGGPMMYWSDGVDAPTFLLEDIDDPKTGEPAVIPAPWSDTYAPPDDPMGQNMPCAFRWDAVPTLALTLGGDIGKAAVDLGIEGWTLTDGTVAPDQTVVFQKDEPLGTSLGVWEPKEPLQLEWTDLDGNVIGTLDLPLRVYLVLGPATFPDSGDEHQAWVAAIDPALRYIAGVEPTPQAVTSALVDYIFDDLGLYYDIEYGASAYNNYEGFFTEAVFPMTAFLDRRRGDVVNCSDCAGILNAYANMLGADLFYAHIFSNFDLNYIEAIGYPDFTHCPFGEPWGCGFSYHAVTTLDDAATIWDATLALDGDEDPSSDPSKELRVHGVPGDEYLDRLSPDDVYYDSIGQGTLK